MGMPNTRSSRQRAVNMTRLLQRVRDDVVVQMTCRYPTERAARSVAEGCVTTPEVFCSPRLFTAHTSDAHMTELSFPRRSVSFPWSRDPFHARCYCHFRHSPRRGQLPGQAVVPVPPR